MVGRALSFWEGLFSGAMLVDRSVVGLSVDERFVLQADERYFERHGEPLFSSPSARPESEQRTGYLMLFVRGRGKGHLNIPWL